METGLPHTVAIKDNATRYKPLRAIDKIEQATQVANEIISAIERQSG